MMYNNLLYFLVAIVLFSSAPIPQSPWLSAGVALPLAGVLLFVFYLMAGRVFSRCQPGSASYFRAEKKLSILALLFFCIILFFFDAKYYLHPLSLNDSLPVLENLGGLVIFFLLLSLIWLQGRRLYGRLFQKKYSAAGFVLNQCRINLPIVLPWLLLSVVFDLLALLPFPMFQDFLFSFWGDLFFFLVFVALLILVFPPIIRWLWNCRPLENGQLRREIETFCAQLDFSADILYWPVFEGQAITAAVMGIIPRLRYLLVTKALLFTLDRDELASVVAHEVGHVKKLHIVLYALLFLGFSLLVGAAAEPMGRFMLGSGWFYRLNNWLQLSPEGTFILMSAVPVLILMIVYFRYVFGFFLRNFERQADLYVFKAQGTARYLISSFEKIARQGGNIRDKKNWHHFGIGERIDYLERCEADRRLIKHHDRKLYTFLGLYVMTTIMLVLALSHMGAHALSPDLYEKYTLSVLEYRLKNMPESEQGLQMLGRFFLDKGLEKKAIAVYNRAHTLLPGEPEVANNLAWLLLTARDRSLRDGKRALALAREAVNSGGGQGFVLDTLATALWANGLLDEALAVEQKAARHDPEKQLYYQRQMKRFSRNKWKPTARSEGIMQ